MKKLALSALTALGVSAGALHAAPITVNYQDSNDVFGPQGWYDRVTIDSPVFDGTFRAGQFALNKDGVEAFLAFCVEVTQAIVNGDDAYESTPNLFSSAVLTNIDKLFSSAYDLVTDGLSAAGFQVALWEIVEDTANGIDLSSGAFSAVDAASSTGPVVATAQSFLDGLATAPTGVFDLEFLASPSSQDLVTARRAPTDVSSVPIPASGLLLLSAGGLLVLRRRKS